MVAVPIRIKTTYTQPPDLSKRKWKEAMRAGHWAIARMWHAMMLPLHFRRNAKTRYGHKPRHPKYVRKKKRFGKSSRTFRDGSRVVHGGEVDNAWSGQMERNIREWVTIRAFPSRATAYVRGPRYLSMRPFNSKHPDKAAEITEVTADEQTKLEKEMDRMVNMRFTTWTKTKTVST
jgi:hypothetical protein